MFAVWFLAARMKKFVWLRDSSGRESFFLVYRQFLFDYLAEFLMFVFVQLEWPGEINS